MSETIAKMAGIVLITTLLLACGNKQAGNASTDEDSTILNGAMSGKTCIDSVNVAEDIDHSECIREQASSVIRKIAYPDAIFKLNPDKHSGTETVSLKNGDKLVISNWGCEYYILTFRFETERFQADTTNTAYWLDKAATLMTDIQDAIDAPLDLKGGIEAIPLHLASMDNRLYELGEEIVFNDNDIRDFVTLDRIQKINEKRFAVEISFATGPL